MNIHFNEEKIGTEVSAYPVYQEGYYAGLIEGPASSGRATWRAIFRGERIGDFKTADAAKKAILEKASSFPPADGV